MHEENIETTKEKPDLIHDGKNSLNENNNSSKNESAEHIEKPSDCEHDNNNSINEFDSSSDIHELEGTFECSERAQNFSSQSSLKVHLTFRFYLVIFKMLTKLRRNQMICPKN